MPPSMCYMSELKKQTELWYVAATGGILAGLVSWPLYGTAGKQ